MADLTGRVPLLAVPGPERLGRPSLPIRHRTAVGEVVRALGQYVEARSAVATGDERTRGHLSDAVALARGLARSAGNLLACLCAPTQAPASALHRYFRLRTLGPGRGSFGSEVVCVVAHLLQDLVVVDLTVNDVTAEVAAMTLLLDDLCPPDPTGPDPADGAVPPTCGCRTAPGFEPCGDGVERWVLGHHLYCVLNVAATVELRSALAAVRAGRSELAACSIDRAAVHVRGATAAMLHAGAVPRQLYLDVIRPSMRPPQLEENLSGSMIVEHRSYRAALDELLAVVAEPFTVLARRDLRLARSREELLEADLIDIERHVVMADELVGRERSLTQHVEAPENSVSMLRRMRHRRALRYRELVEFGDRSLR